MGSQLVYVCSIWRIYGFFGIKLDGTAPQLARYYNMAGAVDWDWLTGMIDFNATAFGETTIPLNSNGDNLYFNAFIYGDPLLPNSRIYLDLKKMKI